VRVWKSWATRSLAIGAGATLLDLLVGTSMLVALHVPTRAAAMTGTVLGAAFTFVANRHFAFKDSGTQLALARSIARFAAATLLASVVHGQLVVWLRDALGVPFVPSKIVSDLLVFTLGQLVLLRYVVFPKPKAPAVPVPAPRITAPHRPRPAMLPVVQASATEPLSAHSHALR
jgi:putative flippase GtrA